MENTMGHSDLYSDATDDVRQGVDKIERAAHRGLDQVAHRVDSVRDAAGPVIDRLRHQVARASDRTLGYVHEAPVRSALVALAAGAVVFGIVRLLSSRSSA
ncbi:hypothetical protein DBR42_22540 [Pelomonas sp. HMWF004]|nr:hypothetical protein DBR42_22540 [Pelomonas sp. HMWF004]